MDRLAGALSPLRGSIDSYTISPGACGLAPLASHLPPLRGSGSPNLKLLEPVSAVVALVDGPAGRRAAVAVRPSEPPIRPQHPEQPATLEPPGRDGHGPIQVGWPAEPA